ncbi:MAG TPA: haloacid dehalogenase type II [Burkholderiales bacterium]|jgi:2-haloacid dehalogenase
MAIDVLLYDAYGTLWDVHSVMKRCERCWPGKGMAVSQVWRTKQLEATWLRSLMGRYVPFSTVTREALGFACEALHLPLQADHESELMGEYLKLAPFPDVADALMRKQAARTGILSNGSPDMLEPLVLHSGLKFDAVLSVDAAKVFKPAPQAYQLAVEHFGVPKERIGFVSSNFWDAAGAKSFGFTVYWINRAGVAAERLGFQPDRVVKSLAAL